MTWMKFQQGQRVRFPFNGGEHTGIVDAHEVGGFVIVRDADVPKHPVVAVRDSKVRPAPTDQPG